MSKKVDERYIVDTTGSIVDIEERVFYDYPEDVCKILNNYHNKESKEEENIKTLIKDDIILLKQRNFSKKMIMLYFFLRTKTDNKYLLGVGEIHPIDCDDKVKAICLNGIRLTEEDKEFIDTNIGEHRIYRKFETIDYNCAMTEQWIYIIEDEEDEYPMKITFKDGTEINGKVSDLSCTIGDIPIGYGITTDEEVMLNQYKLSNKMKILYRFLRDKTDTTIDIELIKTHNDNADEWVYAFDITDINLTKADKENLCEIFTKYTVQSDPILTSNGMKRGQKYIYVEDY